MVEQFIEIWNEAYNVYVNMGSTLALREYLKTLTEAGTLTKGDAQAMYEDIIDTADL